MVKTFEIWNSFVEMAKQDQRKSKVSLNSLVKVRFEDGYEMLVSIFEKQKSNQSSGFQVNREAPLGNALLGHTIGEIIEYEVESINHQVTILKIYDPLKTR